MPEIEWTEVRSSNVRKIAWADGELLIEFANGSVYAYPSAGEAAFQDLTTATSPGGYVARHLRQQPSRRIS